MTGSDFIFDYDDLMYDICHRIQFERRGSYIDPPDWKKNKKAIIY